MAPLRGDVQGGHGVVGTGDFGVGRVAAGGAGVVAAAAVAFAVGAVWRDCSGFWRLLGCRWWDLVLWIYVGREATLGI